MRARGRGDPGPWPGGSPRGPSEPAGRTARKGRERERGKGEATAALEAGTGGVGAERGGLEPGAWDTAVADRRGAQSLQDGACFLLVKRILPRGLLDTGACRALALHLPCCCHGRHYAWGPGLPAILGLRGLAVVRDYGRPRGPALPEPSRLAHFGTVTAA